MHTQIKDQMFTCQLTKFKCLFIYYDNVKSTIWSIYKTQTSGYTEDHIQSTYRPFALTHLASLTSICLFAYKLQQPDLTVGVFETANL